MNIHAGSASCDLSSFRQAVNLALSVRFLLALHKVIVERTTACADKVRSREQGSRGSTDLLHLGYMRRHGRRVNEGMPVESVRAIVSTWHLR